MKAKRITEGMTVIYNEFNFVYRGNLNNGTGNRKHLMDLNISLYYDICTDV